VCSFDWLLETNEKAAKFNGVRRRRHRYSQLNPAVRLKLAADSRVEGGNATADYDSVIDYRYHYGHRIIALFATDLEDTALMRTIVSVVLQLESSS